MITKYPGSYFMSASYIMEAVRGLFCFYGMKVALFKKSSCCKVGIGQQAQAQCNRLAFRVLRPSQPGIFHFLIVKFSYFFIRFLYFICPQ